MRPITTILAFTLLLFQSFAQTVFTTSISASTNDAEEKFDGSYTTATSSDLEFLYDIWNNQGLQTVGLRFTDINIPSNSIISNAYIQFTSDGSSSGDINLQIQGENTANSQPFIHGSSPGNSISSRTTTNESVTWNNIPNWNNNQNGLAQKTPDLSAIVSEIIQNNGWGYGNSLTFIITGNGEDNVLRRAYSYDGNATYAPILTIEYTSSNAIDLAVNNILNPTGNVIYPTPSAPLSVSLSNVGNDEVSDYEVSSFINGTLIQTLTGTESLLSGQELEFDFTNTADFSNTGDYTILFEVTTPNDGNLEDNTVSTTLQVISPEDDLYFEANSDWKYWDSSTPPGEDWTSVLYDDNNWEVGVGKMGFGEDDIVTTLTTGSARYNFRKKIYIDDINEIDKIFFHVMHDDGAVIFINGQEVLRTELMPSTTIGHNTTARQRINHSLTNQFITYTIDKSFFINGENQIAIAIHNVDSSDGDLTFNSYATPSFEYSQDGPYIFYQQDSVVVTEIKPEGAVTNTYSSIENMEFTCHIPLWDNKSFSFSIQPDLTTEPSIITNTPSKFLVISDFDNNIEAFSMVLLGEGIMDEDFNWTYGNGHLVITGDLFDRGLNSTECLWLLYKLEAEAVAQGGGLHFIIGNHEMMQLLDDWRYKEGKYFTNAQLMDRKMLDLYDEKTEIGRWLRTKNIIMKLGDYALMHGGLSPQVAALDLTYQEINNFGRARMNGESCTGSCATTTGSNGVYWYRGMANEELSQQQVDDILSDFDVKRVIFGHTKGATIRSLYNGKVLAIDMYHMTNFSNGFMEALQFEMGCFRIFNTNGTQSNYTQLDECDDYLSINELNKLGFKIYPNPSTGKINIILPTLMSGEIKYTITNTKGQTIASGKLKTETENSIDVSFFSEGTYSIIINDSKNVVSGKFILNAKNN